jgi:transcriptional regulator with GAF, ATPase, and Fis domain
METPRPPLPQIPDLDRLLIAVGTVFESLGRALVCLGPDFRAVHASQGLEALVGRGAREAILGRPVESFLGEDLFGQGGPLRRALEAGERREGRGAVLRLPDLPPRPVSLSVAPLISIDPTICDPRVAFFVMLRPGEDEEAAGEPAPTEFAGMIARSASMLAIFRLVRNLEESEATVLVTGESGTGKELVARALHLHSPRGDGPFVAVNCAALPPDLLESELFGHVRGAFTGAVRDREGRFEVAQGGTLFLDEMGDLPLQLQAKLLRVLQEHTFERVGESRTRSTDARILAATNRDLAREVEEERFREDLYYRLRVVPVEVPPLRHRREDIVPLARHLLRRVAARQKRSLRLAPDALRALLAYDWPGNVRELENALEYAVTLCQGQTVHAENLPSTVLHPGSRSPAPRPVPRAATVETSAPSTPSATAPGEPPPPPIRVGDPDRETLRRALDAHRWRREETARALGISRTTLWRKMRELGLGG